MQVILILFRKFQDLFSKSIVIFLTKLSKNESKLFFHENITIYPIIYFSILFMQTSKLIQSFIFQSFHHNLITLHSFVSKKE
jgi:hypothetical protein